MTRLEAAAWAFTLLNALRIIGYVPQIAAIWRDEHRATAISLSAWTLWAASHLSTAAYVLEATGDRLVGAMMLANAALCTAIVLITRYKRRDPGQPKRACAETYVSNVAPS
jgi:hypothetical protein